VLTREDANSESALVAEWLVDDWAEVRKGRPVCVVETSKASVEIEAAGDGVLVQLVPAGIEVGLGTTIALVAQGDAELAAAEVRQAEEAPEPEPGPSLRNVTRKAAELAAKRGVDLEQIDKTGFITAEDVEAVIAAAEPSPETGDPVLAGLSTENVSLPALFGLDESVGALDAEFLASLRADPDAFAALSSEEKCAAYRRHGARVGEGVTIGPGAVVVAPRIVLENGVAIRDGGTITCEEVFAAGELASFGLRFRLACQRAFVGAGLWSGRDVFVGGGGHRDPWATFAIGDLGFVGDEAYVNVARPVLIGREAFVTMRSMLVTHNIGHSPLEGFENRFAGIVLEDRAQIGLGAVVYAGCRVGRESIVASNSYVVSDIPPGSLAVGVPARVAGAASRPLTRPRQAALARHILAELRELFTLLGVETTPLAGAEGFELTGDEGPGRVLLVERLGGAAPPGGEGETVVLTLEAGDPPPGGAVVLDLLARRAHGFEPGVLTDSVREFCRKRGIRFEPGPWRYPGGLV
jgi:acetyltransferase-like isoleucine patch superfamily enzyme